MGVVLVMVMLSGCSLGIRSTPTPIPTLLRPVALTGRSETLVVCLPGRGDSMAEYEREGIVSILRESSVRADAVIVDAHLAYYYNRTVVDRLRTDVLLPARQQGYSRIVLVGVSLGSLGGLLSERDNPGLIDALVLLGPYLGEDNRLFDQIVSAGGPRAWAAARDPRTGKVEEQLWTFLGTKTAALPVTWLLSGRADKYGRGQRLFAGLLPATRIITVEGGHDWPTWRGLWRDFCLHSELFNSERAGESPATPDAPSNRAPEVVEQVR